MAGLRTVEVRGRAVLDTPCSALANGGGTGRHSPLLTSAPHRKSMRADSTDYFSPERTNLEGR